MNGLNSHEIEYRINNDMVNNENIKNSRSLKTILLTNIITLFNLIHLVLFILVLTTKSINNATFIVSILFNMFISIYQEIKAKRIIDKLSIANVSRVRVIRDGETKEILPSEVVIDDLLYLKQGDSLIVDAEVVKSNNVEVDESVITGESNSIIKKQGDKLISGSIILCGSVYAKVTSINRDTYANNLIKEASKTIDDSSYLKKCINSILKVVTILIIPIGILLFVTQFFYSGQTYSESVLSSVAGIIGMIPEGLVLLTSISLTVGVIKMASKKVIIQKLNGIELLACVDTLCLDKTGTITDGSMDVVDVIRIDKKENIDNIISNMLIDKINATDIALSKYFGSKNDLEIIDYVPFSSARKYSLVKFKKGTYAIGALEYLTNKDLNDYNMLNEYIDNGYRIITFVKCKDKIDKKTNKVLGFIILKDNIRKNAKETLEYFKTQGVNIKIISGDNPKTVSNILKQLSMDNYDKYISGNDLPEDYEELKKIINKYTIYGRVTPYQKQMIIKALKENYTVGMIGDGVNDILALKEADCGIALASGISAARSVSEVVLTESDFGVLPNIVNEGRRVVNNIERVASMYLIKTVYSFLISILCIVFNHEYPFYPVQLSLIGITCVGLPSFFLALEPNYNKVEKGFLVKVFRNALPSGLCVTINILFLIMFTYIFKLDFEAFRLIVVGVTGYLNLRLLYKISLPLSLFRKILLSICSISFCLLLILFDDFFLIKSYNFLSFIFIIIFIFANNYICDFFEEIYDKIVLWIERIKRRKIVSENK
ncbi:MAG: HAD-IC family P-type ATPase [Bacilli bacterium]|nr:HAD-IC family P-type ATPase [Bacilli bacterium]